VSEKSILPKNCLDLFIKLVSAVTNIKDLKGLFNSNLGFESLVVHKELHDVEKLARLKPSIIRDATLVHGLEFFFANIAI
jgi:hypothetical protein